MTTVKLYQPKSLMLNRCNTCNKPFKEGQVVLVHEDREFCSKPCGYEWSDAMQFAAECASEQDRATPESTWRAQHRDRQQNRR